MIRGTLRLISALVLSQSLMHLSYAGAAASPAKPCFYIDLGRGNDSYSGLSKERAWRTIPGTRTRDDNDWIAQDWGGGTISKSRKVKPGTTFLLQPRSRHDSRNGGTIRIDKTFYEEASERNPVSFIADSGNGSVVFDGAGIRVDIALFLIRIDGVQFDGMRPGGIIIRNSSRGGMQVKEKSGGGDAVRDISMRNILFENNGTTCTRERECDDGQLNVRNARNLLVERCRFDGNGNHLMGLMLGEKTKAVTNATIRTCTALNHRGNFPPDDRGIGFKAFNSSVLFESCSSYANLKGFDLGEHGGKNTAITYTLINNIACGNSWGINMNSAGDYRYAGKVRFYLINNIVHSNHIQGSNIYGGPFSLYAVHNVFARNGTDSPRGKDKGNLRITPSGPDDGAIDVHLYNNIFYRPAGHTNFTTSRYYTDQKCSFNLHSDHNVWIADGGHRHGEYFCRWAFFDKQWQYNFAYDSNGPGKRSGGWFLWYDKTPAKPANKQNGHFGCDANSKVSGAANKYEALFRKPLRHDYRLLKSCGGIDLATHMKWYISEMGKDFLGKPRVRWDRGAFESD